MHFSWYSLQAQLADWHEFCARLMPYLAGTAGHTAALIARLRPPVTQIVVTSDASQGRRLSALFGAEAFVVSDIESVAAVMEPAKEAARSLELLKPGQMVVQVHGRNQPDADGDTTCAMQLVS